MKDLIGLAKEVELREAIASMFNGSKINQTERRSVLHVALRNRSGKPMLADGVDVMPDVNKALAQMRDFSGRVLEVPMERLYWKINYRYRLILELAVQTSDLIWSRRLFAPTGKYYATFCFYVDVRIWLKH